uniref:Uncharacterized protein n=1 Tax=Oryza punctata TaxID=4537 RepID=A0A0E0JLN3_ORYPU
MKLRSGFMYDWSWAWAVIPAARVNLLLLRGGEAAKSSDSSMEMWTEDGDDGRVEEDGATSRRTAPPFSTPEPQQDVSSLPRSPRRSPMVPQSPPPLDVAVVPESIPPPSSPANPPADPSPPPAAPATPPAAAQTPETATECQHGRLFPLSRVRGRNQHGKGKSKVLAREGFNGAGKRATARVRARSRAKAGCGRRGARLGTRTKELAPQRAHPACPLPRAASFLPKNALLQLDARTFF